MARMKQVRRCRDDLSLLMESGDKSQALQSLADGTRSVPATFFALLDTGEEASL